MIFINSYITLIFIYIVFNALKYQGKICVGIKNIYRLSVR